MNWLTQNMSRLSDCGNDNSVRPQCLYYRGPVMVQYDWEEDMIDELDDAVVKHLEESWGAGICQCDQNVGWVCRKHALRSLRCRYLGV